MRTVIISGSERPNGITRSVSEQLKMSFEEKSVETHVIYLNSINFSPCDGCGTDDGCNYRDHACEKDDDMKYVIETMVSADIIIYAAPVHAFGICYLMQIFLERAGVGYLRFNRPLANKVGGCVIVGRKYNLGSAHDQILNNMLLNRMIIPGSGFPVLVHGDETTKSIKSCEELVALEQMINRLIEMARSIDYTSLNNKVPNERILLNIKEKQP
ncbi:flavodoxin family protein [Vibrio sp. DNB22_10_4]